MRPSKAVNEEHRNYLKALQRKKMVIYILQAAVLVAVLGLWELAARLNIIDPFIFSSPSRMVKTLVDMIVNKTIYEHVGTTLIETIVGFLSGTVIGVVIAIVLWASETARKVFDPYLVVLNSLPKMALGPIVIVWVGAGMSSIIVITLLISIIVTIIGVLNGYMEVDSEKIKLLKTFGASKKQIFTHVVFPASIPTMISILKINVGMSWVGVIVGEFLVSKAGLGYLIVYGGQVFKLDLVMASVLILCVLATVMYYLVALLEKWINKTMFEK